MDDMTQKDSLPLFQDAPEEPAAVVAPVAGVPAVASPPGKADNAAPDLSQAEAALAALREPAPEVKTPPRKPVAPGAMVPPPPGNGGFGNYLRELRKRSGMDIDALAAATKIRSTYLEAIEREDYDDLPPIVYVLAYVKSLCGFYQLSPEYTELVTGELRQRLEYEAPDDPSKSVLDVEVSQENPILLKKILLAGMFGFVGVAVLITVVVLVLTSGSTPPASTAPTGGAPVQLDEKTLIDLQKAPQLEVHVLPEP